MGTVKEEKFELNRNLSGITETDVSVVTGEGLQEAWAYRVPIGHTLIFSGADTFSAYLEDAQPAEAPAGTRIDIVVKEPDKQNSKNILNELRYTQVKEFQDVDLLTHLDIAPGKVVVVPEQWWVTIRGNLGNQVLDASDSYFTLTCKRVRTGIYN